MSPLLRSGGNISNAPQTQATSWLSQPLANAMR